MGCLLETVAGEESWEAWHAHNKKWIAGMKQNGIIILDFWSCTHI